MSGRLPGVNKPPVTRVGLVRALRGVSQADMAKATGLSLASWRRFERGERPATLEVWINTAYALGCRFEHLVGEERLETWTPTKTYVHPPNAATFQKNDIDYDDILDELDAFEPPET